MRFLSYILLVMVSSAFLNTYDGFADIAKPKKTTKVKIVQIYEAKKKEKPADEE